MPELTRKHIAAQSEPTFLLGACPACSTTLVLDPAIPYPDNPAVQCARCGRSTVRHELITESLAQTDTITWSLAASDFVVWDRFQMTRDDYAVYTLDEPVRKWLREDSVPRPGSGLRYIPEVAAFENSVFVTMRDTLEYSDAPENPPPPVEVTWYRFGLSDLTAVPAWRQSMFAAAMMIGTNPAAALVLIAAGFEAFFTDTMRIKWHEARLRKRGFRDIIGSQRIATLVDWLPGVVGLPSLVDAPDGLHGRWKDLVNGRRNDVVHKANVHFSPDEARESLRCALECVSYVDKLALFRPHPYYAGE